MFETYTAIPCDRMVKMTKQELLDKLANLPKGDPEAAHGEADGLLLDYIDDKDIREAWKAVEKWYA